MARSPILVAEHPWQPVFLSWCFTMHSARLHPCRCTRLADQDGAVIWCTVSEGPRLCLRRQHNQQLQLTANTVGRGRLGYCWGTTIVAAAEWHIRSLGGRTSGVLMRDYVSRDHAVWEGIFAGIPREWYEAPPSDAMKQCSAYFAANPCRRVLDVGCGFGRWAQFVARAGVREVVGIDYAEGGVRAASAWARRDRFSARFVVASAMSLPFRDRSFDGVLAAVLLDNLSRSDCLRVVRALNSVAEPGAHGFFVFNPVLTPAELATIPDGNPTKGCMHVVYADRELPGCLPGWSITRLALTADRFRVIEAEFHGRGASQQGVAD